ncbi:lipocalin family protein [Emticicia sp.]|uniref:lipocalin family protein n=1 Tax=Emticicia sp. TaxID=1930953 RepID=UPI003BAB8AE9
MKVLVVSLLSVILTNCSKDTPSAQIVGSWKITNIFVKQGAAPDADQLPALVKALPCAKEIVFNFQKKGKVSYSTPTECQSIANNFSGASEVSEYEINEDKLIITGKSTNTFGLSLSSGTMTWTIVDGSGTASMTTTRIILQKQ